MADGAPISQEIRLPTDVDGLTSAAAKLDAIIARVEKLERATARHASRSESHGRKTESSIDGVGKAFERAGRHSESASARIRHSVGGVGHAIKYVKNETHDLLEAIGLIAAFEIGEKIVDKVMEIGKEMMHAAAMAERMNFAIDAAAGGKEGGERTRKFLEGNSKFSEFSEAQNESAYLYLKRFGVGQQKAGLFMKGAEDLAAVADPAQREGVYQEALSAFARVHARGKIDTRSAMRLGIGVEDFATLPQFKGQNRKQISKALQGDTAHVSENDLLNLIMHRTGEKAIGERAADASQLLLTRMAKLSELPERFYKRLSETGAVAKLSESIGGILEKLDPDSPNGKKIFGALEATFNTIAETVHEIDFDQVASTITDDVLPALKLMASMIGPIVGAVERIAHGFGQAAMLFGGPAATMGVAAAGTTSKQRNDMKAAAAAAISGKTESQLQEMGVFGRAWQGVKGALHTSVGMATGGSYVPFREEFAAAARDRAGKAIGDGFADGINASMPQAAASVMSLGEGAHDALMSSIDAHSPSRMTEEVGGHFGEGFAQGIEGSSGRIEDAMDSTMRIPAAALGGGSSIAGLGGAVSVTFAEGAIQIVVSGAGDQAGTADAVRDELARSIRPMLVDILEETRGEEA